MKIIVTIILRKLVTIYLLALFCPFVKTKNENQVDGLVKKIISVFSLSWVALYFKGMSGSTGFYE